MMSTYPGASFWRIIYRKRTRTAKAGEETESDELIRRSGQTTQGIEDDVNRLVACRIRDRPNTSESGALNRGTTAVPNRKIERDKIMREEE